MKLGAIVDELLLNGMLRVALADELAVEFEVKAWLCFYPILKAWEIAKTQIISITVVNFISNLSKFNKLI